MTDERVDPYDVCIIGAGVVGCAVARELSRFRLRILLVERSDDVGTGATKANSGIVHGAYSSPRGTLKAALCSAGNRMYRRLDEELHFGFRKTGALVLAFSREQERSLQALYENGLAAGDRDLELLDGAQARGLEPRLGAGVTAALHCPAVGVASPYEMAIALAENAVANGVELRLSAEVTSVASITSIRRPGGAAAGPGRAAFLVTAGGGEARARFVVNAAGVYGEWVAAMVGEPGFWIIPRQGQYLLFAKGTGQAVSRVIFQVPTPAGKGIVVTSTYHGNLLIGPDANEVADPEDAGTSLAALERIVVVARRSLPGFDLRRVITSFAGVRATANTRDFVIGEGAAPGFFNAAGIDSPGLTSAPAIAERIRDLLADAGLELNARSGFQPSRPPIIVPKSLEAAEAARLLEAAGPERIVCRCEQVSEAEVVDALRRGIPVSSIDAVKRRTRAGMGHCQGTYCRPRVAALIERETGARAADVIRLYEERLAAKRRVRTHLVRMIERSETQSLDRSG
jgi:glycerol-3-phosphate dehydrogenase